MSCFFREAPSVHFIAEMRENLMFFFSPQVQPDKCLVYFLSNCNHIGVYFPVLCCLLANRYVLLLLNLLYFRACSVRLSSTWLERYNVLKNLLHSFLFSYSYLNLSLLLLFIDGVHLSQGSRGITRRQFTFYH